MSFQLDKIFAPLPTTERGKAVVLGRDPKLKNFIYAGGMGVVIRDIANPEKCDIYQEHNAPTTVAKYAPSGFYIASGDASGMIRIWDTTQKEHPIKFEMRALGGRINDLDWTEDSKRIVAVGEGREFFGKAFMFDTGASVGEISGCSKNQLTCAVRQQRPYRLAIGGEDCDIQHFNAVPFKWEKRVDSKATRFINTIRYAPDGSRYAVGSSDKLVQLYDGKTGDRQGELPSEHTGSIFSMHWTDDGKRLLTASGDKTCRLWDVEAGKCVTTFTFGDDTDDQQVGTLCQAEYLLSVSLSGNINYLDERAPDKPSRVLHGHQKTITSLHYNDGNYFSGSYDSVITMWNSETGATRGFSGKGHTSQINGLAVSEGNLVSAAVDSTVRVTPLSSLEYGASFGTDTDAVGVVTGNKDQSLIFAAALDGIVRVQANGGTIDKTPVTFGVSCIAISPDDKLLAVGGADHSVRIFTINDGRLAEAHVLKGHRGKLNGIQFSPDGKWLGSVCQQRDIYIWETASWEVKTKAWGSFHTASITCIAWHPNSDSLATGGLDQYIFIWTVSKKTKRIKIERAHQGGVSALSWSSDTTLASVGQDNALKTWNITLHK